MYSFGLFGGYQTAHVQCAMGSGSPNGSTLTLATAIRESNPRVVLVLGIAFGIDRKKMRLGDVLIADSIFPYELAKMGARVQLRGQSMPSGQLLRTLFRDQRHDWRYGRGVDEVVAHQGMMASGEKLVNSQRFRDELVGSFVGLEAPIGGEMEGAGAYSAAQAASCEIILVKSVCDWADGEKNDRAQPFASRTAVDLARHILNKPDVLLSLGARQTL